MVTITTSRCVQCLGVCIDSHLDIKKHVSQTIIACSFYLCNINEISRFLPRPTKERVGNAIITSRLDYWNALLYGMSAAVTIARLQRIHNTAARLIMRSPRSDSATPLLRELHWLPIERASLARKNEAGGSWGRRSIYSMLTYRTVFCFWS